MLTLGLLAVLHAAPASSAPSVIDQVGRIHLAQVEVPPPSLVLQNDPRSLYELTREYQRVQDERPGIGFPVAFMAIGTGLLLVDLLLFVTSLAGLSTLGFSITALPIYIALAVIGAGFLVTGVIVLPLRLRKRAEVEKHLEELAALIRLREQQAPPVPQYDQLPPPPPPPPPPVGLGNSPEPRILLAEF